MFWFRDASSLALLPWLAAFVVVWLGGWLLASHAFKLSKQDRLVAGLGLGVVLWAWFSNLVGRWLNAELIFWAAAALVMAAGAVFAWRGRRPLLARDDLRIWPWLLAGLGLVWLFLLWSKGLAIFDEHKNLSLISVIANGDIPPRYALFGPFYLAYHYGFHVFAASLMRLGGMLPWSAFDAGKSIAWGITLLLAALLGRRVTGHSWGGWATAAVLALASGTRYLLLLLPPGLLLRADALIHLQGNNALIEAPFSQALLAGWPVGGGPPFPYPFAFLNGILQPFVMAHQGPNIFSMLILLLLWLLLPRLAGRGSAVVLALVLAIWALVWESSYVLFLLGLFGFAGLYYLRRRSLNLPFLKETLLAAALSVPIALLQGGTLTELARSLFTSPGSIAWLQASSSLLGNAATNLVTAVGASPQPASDFFGFTLRWPPAISSSHLGALSLFSPVQLLVALFELGPVILFTPWLTRWALRAEAGEWLLGALTVAAWIGFLMPILLEYRTDRDISRLTSQALLIWTLMLVFLVADRSFAWRAWLRKAALAALALVCLGGLVVAGIQLTAATTTQLGDGFNKLDADISAQVWGTLPGDAHLFGPLGSTTILTGHLAGQLLDDAPQGNIWDQLTHNPNLPDLRKWGYDYVYIDNRWWNDLPPAVQTTSGLDAACVVTVAEVWDNPHINFRRLLYIGACN